MCILVHNSRLFKTSMLHRITNVFRRCYSDTAATVELGDVFKLHNLNEGPPETATLERKDALLYYEKMQLIRRMENECARLYREKAIRGFCHLYNGQEAVAMGMKAVMKKQDNIITSYRCHGWAYLMDISVQEIIAELMGHSKGCSRGKGGSMHLYSKHFFGGNGIVGAQVPLGTGIALANKFRKDGGVTISLYGDGAANQGQVFEAFNMSCLWKLPAIYVCENNIFGMGTKSERAACNNDFYTRCDYIPGIWVDGMNILAVRNATKFARDYVLNYGPIIMEMDTYRYVGHSMSDPGTSYRSREEVQAVRQSRDPIVRFKGLCMENNLLTEDDCKMLDEKARKEVSDGIQKSQNDKEVQLKELTFDIYSKNLHPKIRGVRGHNWPHGNTKKGFNH